MPKFSTAKLFFNLVYQDNYFLEVVDCLMNRHGFVFNDIGCIFPDTESHYEEDHFSGVCFFIGKEKLIVSDDEFKNLLYDACEKYKEIYPEYKLCSSVL
ncbi:ribonuclease toxin immunity protein CdiI [Moraxella pluranimalium]|nr:ribonuclease toxin immunity protein CdiI [Moraxella pluranimalium]